LGKLARGFRCFLDVFPGNFDLGRVKMFERVTDFNCVRGCPFFLDPEQITEGWFWYCSPSPLVRGLSLWFQFAPGARGVITPGGPDVARSQKKPGST
jgi:hypothetical protein